ncbi:cobalt-precorrin-6A reductase [Clostridium sp.]|uniref:cobalt-precorrin-6A reductase n=1 Tax=Clostridium sp. TaxID=1506 RepID=UPI002FC92ED8
MIGFVLGTSEGHEILSSINEFTEDIFVSTSTQYGGDLLKNYKIKHLNCKPLNEEEFKAYIKRLNINIFVDGSHPYAKEVSKTLIKVCKELNVKYIRYERKSYFDLIENNENIIKIDDYSELEEALKNIDGNVLNTTGSNNALNINNLNLKNRVIHRVLPSPSILKKLVDNGIKLDNIIAIKGPFGRYINDGIIKEYNIKAIITKDSGLEGGVLEKVESAFENKAKVILINKPKVNYKIAFNNIDKMIKFIKKELGEF